MEEANLPRIRIDVNKAWIDRFNRVLPAAIDTLNGWEYQCGSAMISGVPNSDELIEQLQRQIIDLRRNLETVRLIF